MYNGTTGNSLTMTTADQKNEPRRLPPLRPKPSITRTILTAPVLSLNPAKRDKPNIILLSPPLGDPFDIESIKGRFGWFEMEQHYIPYLVRNGEKYCSARMFEKTIATFIAHLSPRIYYDCSNIPSWYITNAELALLTEINSFHCDLQFGRTNFTKNDVLVRLEDASAYYKFLTICFGKLFGTKVSNKCGIARMNNSAPFPYVYTKKDQLVPLFFFEGIDPSLLKSATTLTGWPLAYLKFCFRVQGTREEFVKQQECLVANLDELKELFAPDSVVEQCWPTCKLDERLFNKTDNSVWYRLPVIPAPRLLYKLK